MPRRIDMLIKSIHQVIFIFCGVYYNRKIFKLVKNLDLTLNKYYKVISSKIPMETEKIKAENTNSYHKKLTKTISF